MLQRTKQTQRENSATFLALVVLLLVSSWPLQAIAQTALNLDQFRREHLITHGVGDETGNLGIYVSFPNWFGKAGYCPVRIRVTPRKGLQFKENGELKLTIGTGYGFAFSEDSNRQVVISIPIEAGKSEATKEVLGNFLVGENSGFDVLHMKAKLNGRNLRDQQVYIYNARGRGVLNDCKYLCLISEESAQGDSRRLEALKEMVETGSWYSQETHVSAVGYSAAFGNVRNLPPSWLHLSSLQAVSVAWEDLARMDARSLETLNQFVLAGGHLSINHVASVKDVQKFLPIDPKTKYVPNRNLVQSGSNANDLEITLKNFEPVSLDFLEETSWDNYQRMLSVSFYGPRQLGTSIGAIPKFPDDFYQGVEWLCNDLLQVGRTVLDMELARPIQLASYFYDTLSITKSRGAEATLTVDEKFPMLVSHGFGRVYLNDKRRSETQTFSDGELGTISNTYQNNAISQTANYGQSSLYSSNRTGRYSGGIGDEFWDWLIPSVGKTPAVPFLVFVVLFVGVGAPGIMYWSNKHKRRVWLVVLMPMLATICTLFLFSYGLLKDGFGAVSRARSLSFVDTKGNGMVWSRQTYFAASVSQQGVVVGPETHFAPMPANPYATIPLSQQIESADAQQYLGILPPRLQTQFSLTHPLRELPLVKRTAETDSVLNALAIQNAANFSWTKAVFVGPNENYYFASEVKPGQQCKFSLIDRDEAIKLLQKEYKSQPLAAPVDSPSADQTTLAKTFADFFSFRRTSNTSFGQISEETTWSHHIGKAQTDYRVLNEGTFVIFASEAPYLEKCLPNTKDYDGLHMIVGRW